MPDQEEVAVTSAPLMAAARHFGQHCKAVSDEFMVCRFEEKDPAKCVDLGRKVTSCAVEFFKKMKENCNSEFTAHWTCLDNNNQDYWRCRKTQAPYDKCVLDKMGLDGDVKHFLPQE